MQRPAHTVGLDQTAFVPEGCANICPGDARRPASRATVRHWRRPERGCRTHRRRPRACARAALAGAASVVGGGTARRMATSRYWHALQALAMGADRDPRSTRWRCTPAEYPQAILVDAQPELLTLPHFDFTEEDERYPFGARSEAAVFVGKLLRDEVPALSSDDGDLEIVALARRPGVLSKVAIRPHGTTAPLRRRHRRRSAGPRESAARR